MYGNPYINPQANIERINNQIKELELAKNQFQQPIPTPTNLTQNFQLSPQQQGGIKYVNDIEEVKKEFVMHDTLFLNKEHSFMWLKQATGEIKTFELSEIVEKDEKSLEIDLLKEKIKELEGRLNGTNDDTNVIEPIKNEKPKTSRNVK